MTTQRMTSPLHLLNAGLVHPSPCLAMRPHWQLSMLLLSPQIQNLLPKSSSPCCIVVEDMWHIISPASVIRRLGQKLETELN